MKPQLTKDQQLALIVLLVMIFGFSLVLGLGVTWVTLWFILKITGLNYFSKFWYIYLFLVLIQLMFRSKITFKKD